MICPRCGTQNSDTARFCANCGQTLQSQSVVPPISFPAQHLPDPNTAFVLELLLGIFGFLGIGWIYAGQVIVGLVMLIGWWVVVISGAGGSFFTGGLGCCVWLPVHFVAPFVSALVIRSEIEKKNRMTMSR